MRYQDLRVRDAGRVALIASVCTLGAVVSLVFPDSTSRLVEPLPLSRHGNDYWIFLGVTAVMALVCWYIVFIYLFTSPAYDAGIFAKRVAQGKSMPAKFNPALLDATDPAYSVVTWRYALSKWNNRR